MTLAGFPPAIAKSGMDLETTEPACIMQPSPILTPGRMVTFIPIHTLSPMVVIFFTVVWSYGNAELYQLWFSVRTNKPLT